ncbi:hypothetical protein Goarm_022874, partial [Gossypium armourianum]|nr:hypothetical protein [Gossypium armourianum]
KKGFANKRKIQSRQSLSLVNDNVATESVRTSIERQLWQLERMLWADCREINMETLFQRTAHYIFLLEVK